MEYYKKAFQNYSNFSGRATRTEYWMFQLINLLILFVPLVLFGCLLGQAAATNANRNRDNLNLGIGPLILIGLIGIYALFTIIPSLALQVRRLHDIGMSGFLLLIALIPYLGGFVLVVLYLFDSQPGTNQYGPNPKGVNLDPNQPTTINHVTKNYYNTPIDADSQIQNPQIANQENSSSSVTT